MKAVEKNHRLVANIAEVKFKPWSLKDGSIDETQTLLQLDTSKPDGVGFHVFHMEPGTTTTAHRHAGNEEFYIIEGDLTDNDGTKYKPGDIVWMKAGTEHNSYTQNGCTMVVYIERAEVEI